MISFSRQQFKPIIEEDLKIPRKYRRGISPTRYRIHRFLRRSYLVWQSHKFFIILVVAGIFTLLFMVHGSGRAVPPTEGLARQSNMINLTTLLVMAWLWGLGLKFRKSPIPRGSQLFKF